MLNTGLVRYLQVSWKWNLSPKCERAERWLGRKKVILTCTKMEKESSKTRNGAVSLLPPKYSMKNRPSKDYVYIFFGKFQTKAEVQSSFIC